VEAVAPPRLRLGVFAGAARQPRWMVEALARAAAGEHAELVLVATAPGGADAAAPDAALWRAYTAIDERLFGARGRWTAPTDVTRLVSPARRLELSGDDRQWRARAAEARLDVIFVLGEVDDARLGNLSRYGTWRFCFGDAHETCADAGLRDVIEGREVVASGIRIHSGGGRPDRVACVSYARAYGFSPARSRAALFAKTVEFLSRAMRDLRQLGAGWFESHTQPAKPRGVETYRPGAAEVAKLGLRVAQRSVEKALTVEEWSIAYRFGDAPFDGSLDGFHHLHPPKGGFWADPFPIQRDGRNYIFFEELPYGSPKAHISVVEVDREGRASKPVKVLERDYHLSYPFLVEEGGQLYMIPETAENATVEVYRCVEFPAKWKLERVLLRGLRCADATLHREGDRWWMFTTATRPGGADINDELHLFSAETLLGEWTPHRANPVKSDVRSARPAGRLFRQGAQLYRPGQIGAPLYGAGIALHRVTRLTRDDYEEQEDARIVPRSAPFLGIHTLNRAGDLTVTDAFRRRSRLSA
jgi:hypothetical protein